MREHERLYIYLNWQLRTQAHDKHEVISWLDDGEVLFQTIEQALTYIEQKYFQDNQAYKINRLPKVKSLQEYINSKEDIQK